MNTIKAPFVQSALTHRDAISGEGIRLIERPNMTKIMLRGEMKALSELTKNVLGLVAPKPCKSTYKSGAALHWLGPDTVIFIGADNSGAHLNALNNGIAGHSGQAVLVSDHFTIINVSGARARDVLQKLSTLDLHAQSFRKGDVAGTTFAHSTVILAVTGSLSFDLVVRRSHADYLWCLLANAGYEYGLPKQEAVAGEKLRA